jgi:excisionase family DNA binding protein
MRMSELIRTGAAATILGTSRQHVVDLCNRGVLRSHGAGVHRRLDRHAVEVLVGSRRTRDERKSLWLHAAVAGRVATDPRRTLAKARTNLARMKAAHATPSRWLARWETLIGDGPESVIRALVADTPEARELRQNSPFAGALTEHERSRALAAIRLADRPSGG